MPEHVRQTIGKQNDSCRWINRMANQEHLDILKQGVRAWNQWRTEYAHIQPDLSEADLSGAKLCNADLSSANLHEADLSEADLGEANLRYAYLVRVNLFRADLSAPNLDVEDLYYGDTRSAANLSEANCDFTLH